MINLFQKKPKGTEIVFKILGMHCTSCSMNIDGALEDIDGVISASTSYAEAKTKIFFDPEKVSKERLITEIQSLDYGVEEVK